jgi:hypothetical protein
VEDTQLRNAVVECARDQIVWDYDLPQMFEGYEQLFKELK